MGNSDSKAETSVNKEIGLEYKHDGYQAGITRSANDYHNKIESGYAAVKFAASNGTTNIYQWENVPKALVEGSRNAESAGGGGGNWSNNLTWMLSKNKTTGDRPSVIPQFT